MSLITPLALILSALAVPIVLLYMLRLRRRQLPISSTMLWQRLLRDREANAPWQRLRRNLLMFIQLMILAMLVFALARPYLPVPSVTMGSLVVLLDGSASMLAQEENTTRFALAQQEVGRLINDLPGDSQMTLILVGRTPQVLISASQDRAALRQALAQAQAAPANADWPSTLALAAGAAQGFADGRIVLVSDGGLPEDLPPLKTEVIYLPVGSATENLSISALSSREGPGGPQLFASVKNHGQLPQRALFSLSLDGQLFDARHIDVAAGETSNLAWTLPEGASTISAVLSGNTQDNLALDDRAWTVNEGGKQRRVLLVSEGNRFLETALSVLPGIEVFRADPGKDLDEISPEELDLLVLDSTPLPGDLPSAEMLLINPLGPKTDLEGETTPAIAIGALFTNTNVIRLEDSPLLRYVDWSDVNVLSAREIYAPWARSLVTAEGGSLLLAGEENGRRSVILAFRLQDSDLPLQIAFPIVMANIVTWLGLGDSIVGVTDYAPGDPVRIGTGSEAETIVVRKPDGELWTHGAGEAALIFSDTSQLGLYEISSRSADGEHSAALFAVNLMSPAESQIAPVAEMQIGPDTSVITNRADIGQRELWPWFSFAALLVLMVEWWIYHRGTRWPNRDDWSRLTGRRYG